MISNYLFHIFAECQINRLFLIIIEFPYKIVEMPSVLKSTPQYQIQMQQNGLYPFNGLKPSKFSIFVKSIVPFNQFPDTHQIMKNIIEIQNQHAINIQKITESHLHKNYIIVYEYVPYKLNHSCIEIQQYIKTKKYRQDLSGLFKQMLNKGVKPIIKFQNFGFTTDFKLKMYIKPNNDKLTSSVSQNFEKLIVSYMIQCEQLFDKLQFSTSNAKLKNKLADLSEKIKKLNQGFILRQKGKKQKKESQSGRNQSDNSDSLAKTNQNERVGNAHWRFDHDFHFQDSYSQRNKKKIKRKRHSSFKDGQKPRSQNKQKKASWGQQKSSFVQSDKATVLKKRISEALLKTQKTLTKYEKIRSKSSRKKQNKGAIVE